MKTKLFFLAALLCGVANAQTAPAAAPVEATGTTVVTLQPGGSATISITFPKAKPAKGKKAETGRITMATTEALESAVTKAVAEAKAHADKIRKQTVEYRVEPRNGKLVKVPMLVEHVCEELADGFTVNADPNLSCRTWSRSAYNVEQHDDALRGRLLLAEQAHQNLTASAMRKPDDAGQRFEAMLGGGAMAFLGSVDAGGPVAMLDFLVDAKGSVVAPTLHLTMGEFSDGQGLTGCAAIGGVKPFEAGGATTVGLLAGWCGTTNADLARTDFPHADVQVRHRVWGNKVALGLDFLAGVMLAERVVNQQVVDDKSPEFGALFSAAFNLGELF